ncbi:unnamed protein product [Schistocephalus solidus]|uniref:Similar to n=1 Tax=Schistocephalus solidus TaxID=70667 RepID=A0A183T3Q6_SCHSO|nr:unnamed protein product [Schistocephalus solidus]
MRPTESPPPSPKKRHESHQRPGPTPSMPRPFQHVRAVLASSARESAWTQCPINPTIPTSTSNSANSPSDSPPSPLASIPLVPPSSRPHHNAHDDSLVASRLSVDRYPRWLGWILESATNIPFRPQNEAEETYNRTTLTFNPANCRGTVLAVNSRRRYFSVYHPLLPGSGPRAVSEDEDDEENVENLVPVRGSNRDALRYRNFNKLLNLETDDVDDEDFEESSDASESSLRHRPPDGPLLEQELLHGLCVWLDRLFEGSLRRYHVRDWPTTLVMTDHEEYDRV